MPPKGWKKERTLVPASLPEHGSRVPMPAVKPPRPESLRVGQVYRLATDDIMTKEDGTVETASVLPFLVVKVSKNLMAVRFPFGGVEILKLLAIGGKVKIQLGQAQFDASDFVIHEAGLYQ